jgi:hypothetical protein
MARRPSSVFFCVAASWSVCAGPELLDGYVDHMNLPFMGRRGNRYHVTSCLAALQ